MTLDRFIAAQRDTYEEALEEIRTGAKRSHWMWWVFPQMAGLGHSPTARRYGIADRAEAEAYLAHPVLGARLIEASGAMLGNRGRSAETVLGPVDALKLRSSMTLFDAVPLAPPVFGRVLEAFHGGERDPLTLSLLDDAGLKRP